MERKNESYATGKTLIRLFQMSGRYWHWMVLLLAASIITSFIEVGYMEAIRRIIKGATETNVGLVYGGAVLGICIIVSRVLITTLTTWLSTALNNISVMSLQSAMLTKLADASFGETQRYHTGDLTSRVWDSAREAQLGLNDKLISLLRNIIQIVIAFLYFSWINMTLSLGVIGYTLLFSAVAIPLSKWLRKSHDEHNIQVAERDSFLTDVVQAPEEIRTYALGSYMKGLFENKLNRVFKLSMKVSIMERILDASGRFSTFGGMIFILLVGGLQIYEGHMDIAGLVAFLVASSQLTRPLVSISGLWAELMGAISHANRVFTVFDMQSENVSSDVDNSVSSAKGQGITLHNISFAYSDEQENTLSNLSFSAHKGHLTAITGSSGCGKTTLLHVIAGLYEVGIGNIHYDGLPIQALSPKQLRHTIAYVPQESFIVAGTFRDNITFGSEDAAQERIVLAAQRACIHETIMLHPTGYDTVIGDQGVPLSGGEKQRLALARAFLKNASVLLLDEPTSAQDPINEQRINNALMESAKNMTVIIVTHKLSSIRQADHIVYMNKGQVIDTGTHDELVAKRSGYDQFIKQQEAVVEEWV
ncbi:ABC transporter permease/ATP-binding protein [Paenibacillus baekrokdamisoli]|uniref:ABC transporter permease/ATP-binding protein n=1 Tax=Paenibacillus baekrokdamisoli TaxID=1712516 RepID=A0A3G9J0S4_9BACL|nr:ABC transporter ATP-binding protein [Paenibacillus baekrokdamisoli]MBB3073422.1 ABC-type bacteriocin/lantibiotic exporter with double-glycine peptidase domain [Paenibacillus baekrokdamisoli]BBH24356.1 ABC transporter permease/ATP-binding protein [Paenibacillus baekrokdamisoli]